MANYRKNAPKGYDVHHIDYNHNNNEPNNLIVIPKLVHKMIHEKTGYCDRKEIDKMIHTYETWKASASRDKFIEVMSKNKIIDFENPDQLELF